VGVSLSAWCLSLSLSLSPPPPGSAQWQVEAGGGRAARSGACVWAQAWAARSCGGRPRAAGSHGSGERALRGRVTQARLQAGAAGAAWDRRSAGGRRAGAARAAAAQATQAAQERVGAGHAGAGRARGTSRRGGERRERAPSWRREQVWNVGEEAGVRLGAAQGSSAWLQAARLALAVCGCGTDALDAGGPGQAAMTEEERKAAPGPWEPKASARPSLAVAAMPVRGRNGGGASAGAVR
jgi:hypothetical protein